MYESHLAFLWAYMYSSFVIYEECVQRPMLEEVFDGAIHYTQPLTIRARSLQRWAFAFSRQYSDWDEELLPNPKAQANDAERSYCLKVNGVYLTSVAFLLFHEYAHLTLGHQATNDESWSLAQEVDADNFALSCIADASLSEERRLVAGLSIVLLCASNFFLPKDIRGVWQASHPHLHDRLRNGLSALNLHSEKSQSYLYYLAAISLQQYLQDRGVETLEPVERETASDLFYEYLETIDKLRPTNNQMSAS